MAKNEPKTRGRKPGVRPVNKQLLLWIVLEDYISDKSERQIAVDRITEVFRGKGAE